MNENQEPSVLDYLKSILIPGRKPILIPPPEVEPFPEDGTPIEELDITVVEPAARSEALETAREPLAPLPWLVLLVLLLALAAQLSLEPRADRSWVTGAFLYLIAGVGLVLTILRNQFTLAAPDSSQTPEVESSVNPSVLLISLLLAVIAFVLFGGEKFNTLNLIVWLAAMGTFIYAVKPAGSSFQRWLSQVWKRLKSGIPINVTPWLVLCVAVFI
ncbi:MAG TPA: hypothetical protein VIH16_09805, partial [Bellilinea sp.]